MISVEKVSVLIDKRIPKSRFSEYKKVRTEVDLDIRRLADKSYTIHLRRGSQVDLFVSKDLRVDRGSDTTGQQGLTLTIPESRIVLTVSESSEESLQDIESFFNDKENSQANRENAPTDNLQSQEIVRTDSGYTPEKKRSKETTFLDSKRSVSLFSIFKQGPSAPAIPLTTATRAPLTTKRPEKDVKSSAQGMVHQEPVFTEAQRAVVRECVGGRSVFITGGAGTGKSKLVGEIVKQLVCKFGKQAVAVTATTGLAACSIGGTTIHQFAGLPAITDESDEEIIKQMLHRDGASSRRWRATQALIIDEVSMLSPKLFELLDKLARSVRGSEEPMGGLQVVLCGDFFQLPPVSNKQLGANSATTTSMPSLYASLAGSFTQTYSLSQAMTQCRDEEMRFCFQSPTWGRMIQKIFVLKQVFRQQDEVFSLLLEGVRRGRITSSDRRLLDQAYNRRLACDDGILPTRIFTHKKDVDRLNDKELKLLPGPDVEFSSSDSGDPHCLRVLHSSCPAKQLLHLRVGAQVILVRSILPAEGLVNGARGVVVRFTRETRRPVVKFSDGIERVISCEVFALTVGGRVVAQRLQVPLDLAWGLSVHKAQGMTVDKVVVNLRSVFEAGQAYVALSRVRSLEGLSLECPFDASDIKVDEVVSAYYDDIEDVLRDNKS